MNALSQLIARRYLLSTRQRFVPLLTSVALGGIALGVWSLLVVLSVMHGFQNELNRRWIGLNAHLTVQHFPLKGVTYASLRQKLDSWPEISEIQTIVDGEVIVQPDRREAGEAVAAKIRGVEKIGKEFLERVQYYPPYLPDWSSLEKGELPPVMAGEELAASLGIHPDYEETLLVSYPFGEIGPTGEWVPRQKKFRLSHVFRSGLYEWDSLRLLVPFVDAKNLLGEMGEEKLQIHLKNLSDLEKIEKRLKGALPASAEVSSFAEQNSRLFAALKLERLAMTSFLVLFGLVASFSVTGLLLMFIDSKRRDLGILRAIGLSMRGARGIFLTIGLWLGGIGSLVGGVLGLATCFVLQKFPIPLPATYYLDTLPVEPQVLWGVAVMGIGILLVLVASWYPVHIAGQMDPLPMLREE